MDDQRALLDMLMGKTRNLPDSQKSSVRESSFHDREVCKFYMCGLCPYTLFSATKSDLGRCPKPICDNAEANDLRHRYSLVSQAEKDQDGYEYELMKFIEDLVRQCDQRIQKNKKRAEKDAQISEESLQKIATIESQIRVLSDQCIAAAENGNIDESQEISKRIEVLKTEIENITNPKDVKHTTVCEISGNFMSTKDNDERMRAHFEGKQYLGWKALREKYKALKERNIPPPTARGRSNPNKAYDNKAASVITEQFSSGERPSRWRDRDSIERSSRGRESEDHARRSGSRQRSDLPRGNKRGRSGSTDFANEISDGREVPGRSSDPMEIPNGGMKRSNNQRDSEDRGPGTNRMSSQGRQETYGGSSVSGESSTSGKRLFDKRYNDSSSDLRSPAPKSYVDSYRQPRRDDYDQRYDDGRHRASRASFKPPDLGDYGSPDGTAATKIPAPPRVEPKPEPLRSLQMLQSTSTSGRFYPRVVAVAAGPKPSTTQAAVKPAVMTVMKPPSASIADLEEGEEPDD